jgi:hypothetical protein
MNKTLLLIIVDFLFLNLIALTRWEKSEPAPSRRPPVPALSANAATKDDDLVAAMKQALGDEAAARRQIEQKLASQDLAIAAREQSLARVESERATLAANLADTRKAEAELGEKYASAAREATLTQAQLAQLQREVEARRAEAERQKRALADLEQKQAAARKQIEGLTVAVVVGEQEKQQLQQQAAQLQSQVQAERAERLKVEQTNTQLAEGVGQLAQNSGELSREIRDHRPINANVLFNDYLANRVEATFSVARHGLFGETVRTRESRTVFTTDGRQVYALVEVADTAFTFSDLGTDWERMSVAFDRPPDYHSTGSRIEFLAADPRVVVVPVTAAQVTALGAKVYPLAADPFKFPDALLINGGGKGYGEVGFKLDDAHPGYVRVDNRLFKRIFGDFAPSRGDLVLSRSGELLGIMVNRDYCVLVKDFTAAVTFRMGDSTGAQHTGSALDGLSARVRAMPLDLQ